MTKGSLSVVFSVVLLTPLCMSGMDGTVLCEKGATMRKLRRERLNRLRPQPIIHPDSLGTTFDVRYNSLLVDSSEDEESPLLPELYDCWQKLLDTIARPFSFLRRYAVYIGNAYGRTVG